MIRKFKLTPEQWKLLASALSNISQATLLFSGAAFFVPEAVSLSQNFSKGVAFVFFLVGLILFLNQNTPSACCEDEWFEKNLPEGILRSLLRSSSLTAAVILRKRGE